MRDRSRVGILFTVCVLVGSLALLGCPKRPEIQVAQADLSPMGLDAATAPSAPAPPGLRVGETLVTRPTPAAEVQVTAAPAAEVAAATPLKDVFFDFDKSNIRDDQKAALNEDVARLKANPAVKIAVEGHCDERGTAEYNLGLGERRAKAVKDYLVAAGIPAHRIATISYGKERRFVLGHNESAWKWNRRGHFVITGQ